MASAKEPNELMLSFLRDIYYAERQNLKALTKMEKASANEALKEAFMHYREEVQVQVERLQKRLKPLESGLVASPARR